MFEMLKVHCAYPLRMKHSVTENLAFVPSTRAYIEDTTTLGCEGYLGEFSRETKNQHTPRQSCHMCTT